MRLLLRREGLRGGRGECTPCKNGARAPRREQSIASDSNRARGGDEGWAQELDAWRRYQIHAILEEPRRVPCNSSLGGKARRDCATVVDGQAGGSEGWDA